MHILSALPYGRLQQSVPSEGNNDFAQLLFPHTRSPLHSESSSQSPSPSLQGLASVQQSEIIENSPDLHKMLAETKNSRIFVRKSSQK